MKNKIFNLRGAIQLDEDGKPSICGCEVKWLCKLSIDAYSYDQALQIAEFKLQQMYPQYKEFIFAE